VPERAREPAGQSRRAGEENAGQANPGPDQRVEIGVALGVSDGLNTCISTPPGNGTSSATAAAGAASSSASSTTPILRVIVVPSVSSS